MSFPVRRLFVASALSLSLLSGCTGESPVAERNPEVLRMLSWQAPTILNPHLSTGFKDWEASRVTLEPLATYDAEGQMVPLLAAEIPSLENGGVASDGTSVTWTLDPDVKWSDGTPFTAEDVVFTYNYLSNPEVGATNLGVYQAIASVEAIDETTVRVNFKRPNPAWSLPFVGASGVILPKHVFEDYSGANAREAPANLMPVGTGPYRVVEFKPGDVVVYEPNPHYRDAESLSFQRIELKGGGDATSAARAVLQTGDADFADNLQVEPQVLEQLEAGGTGKAIASFGVLGERIEFNYTDPDRANENGDRATLEFPHPFFTDETVRQAFDLAIDREAIATQLYGKAGKPLANFLFTPPQYVSPNTSYEFNLEKAAELLDEAGWIDSNNNEIRDKNGVEMQVVFQTSVTPVRQKTQEIVKQNLNAIGVGVELKSIDSSILFSGDPSSVDTLQRFYADLQMFSTGNSNPDPAIYMKTYTCDEIATPENNWSGQNFSRYCNSEYDALWDRAQTELDPEKRQALFLQMNDLLVRDSVVMPIVHRADVVGVSLQLEGVDPTPWDRATWNIAEWRKVFN
ncbi:peptide ABC transporter substrate-binding protein [Baaleninema simplex]|uniref:peptide ABC transporter substrate-binding protein n=1 Tax=Baaleninema simplex TaxID=2862350 RepID=UPI0003449D89|nr:peptide ABC transporter substrate-binding protein [Baaleninema simplex]